MRNPLERRRTPLWVAALLVIAPLATAPRAHASLRFCPLPGTEIPAPSVVATDATLPALRAEAFGDQTLVAVVDVDARAEQVWSVLTDFETWPEIFDDVRAVEVEWIDADTVSIRHSNERFGWAVEYTALTRLKPRQGRIEVRLDREAPHDVAVLHGVWEIRRSPDGTRTRVALYLRLDSGLAIPRWVERQMLERSMHQTLAAVAYEAKRRCGRSTLAGRAPTR